MWLVSRADPGIGERHPVEHAIAGHEVRLASPPEVPWRGGRKAPDSGRLWSRDQSAGVDLKLPLAAGEASATRGSVGLGPGRARDRVSAWVDVAV